MQHQWRLVEDRAAPGPTSNKLLYGCPRRIKLCMVCGSLKEEVINWRGYVVARIYKSDPVFLAESRKLSDNVHDRRAAYRKLLLGRPPKNACEKCGLIHDSVDCPGDY
jgi:hypothetical protein